MQIFVRRGSLFLFLTLIGLISLIHGDSSSSLGSRDQDAIRRKVKRAAPKFDPANRPVKQTALFEKDNDNPDVEDSCLDDGNGENGGGGNSFTNLWNKLVRKMGIGGGRRRIADELGDSSEEQVNSTEEDEERGRGGHESLLRRLIGSFKPWWEGPNVCKKEDERVTPLSEREPKNGDGGFFTFFQASTCRDTGIAYRCSLKTRRNNSNVVRTLSYECCQGYARVKGKAGCPKRLKPLEQTLVDMNLTRFLEVARDTGLLKTLETEGGNFTIFAPSNKAFEKPSDSDDISFVVSGTNDKMQYVRDVIASHVVTGWRDLDSLEDEQNLKTLKNGYEITTAFYSFPRPFITANCAKVTNFDNQAVNGLIHVIDKVMPQASRNLLQILQDEPRFSQFLSLMDNSTKKLLSDPDKRHTIFAFTDETFEKLPQKTKERIKAKAGCVADIIAQHIVPHSICTDAIFGRARLTTLNKQDLTLNGTLWLTFYEEGGSGKPSSNNDIFVNDRHRIVSHDRTATNGVMQVIDGVVLFPKNEGLLDALNRMGYEDLAKELANAGIEDQLDKGDKLTLFIPPKKDLQNITGTSDSELRRKLLLNHLVKKTLGLPNKFAVVGESNVETEAGSKYRVKQVSRISSMFDPPKRTIGCARMSGRSSSTCENGTIRFIDRLLPLPEQDLMSLLRNTPDLSDFAMMIEAAGMDEDLKRLVGQKQQTAAPPTGGSTSAPPIGQSDDEEDIVDYRTIFAPNNKALTRHVSPDAQRKLLADRDQLTTFIKRHIVDDRLCCHQLEGTFLFNGNRFPTEAANHALNTAGSERGGLQVGDSHVTRCNLEARNGLVHVLDRPLLAGRRSVFDSLFDNWSFRSIFDE